MAMTKTTEGFVPVTIRLPHTAIWKDEKALWRFMDLMFLCSFSDRKVRVRGRDVEVKRGEALLSKKTLCERWGMKHWELKPFFVQLQNDGLVERESVSRLYTRIRVCSFCTSTSNISTRKSSNAASNVASNNSTVNQYDESFGSSNMTSNVSPNNSPSSSSRYTRNTNIRNYKKKENLYIREIELDLEGKYNNPDNFLW